MKCPYCHNADTRVVDSRPVEDGGALRRRRECENCGQRFTTHERTLLAPLMVVKKDGRREEFSADKLLNGVGKACNKRPVSMEAIAELVSAVEDSLRQEGGLEIDAERIGDHVMQRLILLDEVAYVRFASVYQRFDDVKRFAQILDRISKSGRNKRPRKVPTPPAPAPDSSGK